MQTYLFYDIETTGLNKSFDQVLHFAAIRTDPQLQEIERYELKLKLNRDVIPSPGALITHYISLQDTAEGMSEIDAMLKIHAWLNEPGTISIGYNSLGFDDEFLRFSFYRNLLPPYTHQYANQCGRMDLYPITALFYLYKNEVLQWPNIEGKTSLKLENINIANQLAQGRSHDAMIDVEITLQLAKRFFAEHEMWDYALGYFNKVTDQTRYQQLPTPLNSKYDPHREGLMLDGSFGSTQHYQCPVLSLGEHQQYKNQMLWLRLDTHQLQETTEENLPENTWVIRKKWGEPGFVLPPKERFLSSLSADRMAQAEANKLWLAEHPALFEKIIAYHRAYVYPVFPNTDIEARLYLNGFWSEEDLYFCKRFHKASPAEKALLTDQLKNPSLKSLAIRLLGRHYPDHLNEDQKEVFAEYMQQINPAEEANALIDFKGNKRLSPKAALADIATYRERTDLDAKQRGLLDSLAHYLNKNYTVVVG